MIVIALREKIAGADIDKDAGEQCQANAERVLLNLQHHGRCRSGNGRGGVDQKPAKSGAITASVSQYYAYRVDAVGKVVREHRGGDDGADGRGDFKGKTDCDSIEEAVRRQASRADRAASPLFLGPWAFVAMWRDGPVQEHVGDKTDRNRGGDELRAQYRTPQLEGLRDQIEESRADQGACAEAQYQVKSILLIQPEQAAQQRRYESPDANRYRHWVRIRYRACRSELG
jgi:hypothetical protein